MQETPVAPTYIDLQAPVPLYHQLKQHVREQIESGRWPPGFKIPTEDEFCATTRVSRGTVRKAIEELQMEGLLTKKRAKGTFVAEPKIEQPLIQFYGFAGSMLERGRKPTSKVLRAEVIDPPSSVVRRLDLEGSSARVFELVRVRCADDVPLVLETAYLLADLFPGISELDLAEVPLYEAITGRYGVSVSRVHETFECVLLDDYESLLLSVPRGLPALLIQRVSFHGDSAFEFRSSLVRGDKYKYATELRGDVRYGGGIIGR